ncbi:DUF7317 family protein [Natronomonas halophila]|uniref:DUF7317 family protein n=1 Tax=Natronomonas halophila TaxID=2747817 RepID=UPI003CCDD2C9
MTRSSTTTAMTLYRSRTLTLDQAADYTGIPAARLTATLQSHGITLDEPDERAGRR